MMRSTTRSVAPSLSSKHYISTFYFYQLTNTNNKMLINKINIYQNVSRRIC